MSQNSSMQLLLLAVLLTSSVDRMHVFMENPTPVPVFFSNGTADQCATESDVQMAVAMPKGHARLLVKDGETIYAWSTPEHVLTTHQARAHRLGDGGCQGNASYAECTRPVFNPLDRWTEPDLQLIRNNLDVTVNITWEDGTCEETVAHNLMPGEMRSIMSTLGHTLRARTSTRECVWQRTVTTTHLAFETETA